MKVAIIPVTKGLGEATYSECLLEGLDDQIDVQVGLFIAGTVNLSVFTYTPTSLLACPFVSRAEKVTRNKDFAYFIIAEGIATMKNR